MYVCCVCVCVQVLVGANRSVTLMSSEIYAFYSRTMDVRRRTDDNKSVVVPVKKSMVRMCVRVLCARMYVCVCVCVCVCCICSV